MATAILTQPASTPRLIGKGLYMVDSKTATLVAYKVRKLGHGWECNCIAAAYHRSCHHVEAVIALEMDKAISALTSALTPSAAPVGAPRTSIARRAGITLESLFA
jgi:hypothetical protein